MPTLEKTMRIWLYVLLFFAPGHAFQQADSAKSYEEAVQALGQLLEKNDSALSDGKIEATWEGLLPYLKAFFWGGLFNDSVPAWYACDYVVACSRYASGMGDSSFPEFPTVAKMVQRAVWSVAFKGNDWLGERLLQSRLACDSIRKTGKLDGVMVREIYWSRILGHPEFKNFITPYLEKSGIKVVSLRDWEPSAESSGRDK